MATAKELRHRLETLVERLSGEAGREGADRLVTAHGVGVSGLTHHLALLVAGASPEALATVAPDRIGFGSRVLLQDEVTGRTETHHVMSSEAMDLEEDHVSLESPLGAALLGRTAGDLVDVATPAGLRRLRVLAVRSLVDLLEVLDPRRHDLLAGAGR